MATKKKYHHGNLRETFIDIARDALEAEGLAGLSLRKCADRVGVSHTAPKNHFGNLAGLLTAIVTQGYAELASMMGGTETTEGNREQRRRAALKGYVAFAQANPALYDLMFSRDRLINDDPNLMKEVRACFLILADISRDLGWHQGDNQIELDGKSQVALWSLVHGYAQLVTAGRLKKDNMTGLSILEILPKL